MVMSPVLCPAALSGSPAVMKLERSTTTCLRLAVHLSQGLLMPPAWTKPSTPEMAIRHLRSGRAGAREHDAHGARDRAGIVERPRRPRVGVREVLGQLHLRVPE